MDTVFVVIPKVRILQIGMTISFNNQTLEVEDRMVLSNFVFQQLGEKQNGIAVAINGEVKSKTIWQEVLLNEQDDVLIIKATQGG
ncbi:sulfur carrier protein ThiS [compost metagenome]